MPFTVRNSRDALKHVDDMQALKGRKFLTPFPEYMIYMFYSIPESVYFHNLLKEFADGGFERNFSHCHKTIYNRKSSAFSSPVRILCAKFTSNLLLPNAEHTDSLSVIELHMSNRKSRAFHSLQ